MERIGIVGAGIGGLTAAIALSQVGHEVVVLERTARFGRVGADINLTPNAVRALDGLGQGIGEQLRTRAARPTHRVSRMWDTGEETSRLPMSDTAERHYGAPQLTLHRADLLSALEAPAPAGSIRLGHRVVGVRPDDEGVQLELADGTTEPFAAVVGADGIHSVVRTALFGQEHPTFTGVVSYRSVVPRERLAGQPDLDAFTKWWGPDPQTQIVTFPLNTDRDVFVFATTPQQEWTEESWTSPGDVDELRRAYVDFHPEARALLDAADEVLKSALYVRDPLPVWSVGPTTLIGDAAHPMTPFMAQGAGQAIEDAVVLARSLAEAGSAPEVPGALQRYEQARRERTARIQLGSRGNEWLKGAGTGDWVYGYDAWQVPLPA